jgi:hypothetical protein
MATLPKPVTVKSIATEIARVMAAHAKDEERQVLYAK